MSKSKTDSTLPAETSSNLPANLPPTIEDLTGLSQSDIAMLDYTSVASIVNDGEVLKVRNATWRLEDHFDAIPLTAEHYQYHKCSNPAHAISGTYAIGEFTRKGEAIADIHKMWEDDGCSHTVSEYVGVRVLMMAPEEAFNAFAVVTISPTSVKRFEAFMALEIKRQRRLKEYQAVVRFGLASSAVRGAGGKMFKPWDFSFVEEVDMNQFAEAA